METVLVILENDDKVADQNLSMVTRKLVADKIGCIVFEPISGFPEDLPDLAAGVIVGGGLPSVNDPKKWIGDEIDLIKRATCRGLPVLGICFGHQLIAKAFGERVIRCQRKVGFADIIRVENNVIFAGMPTSWRSPVYHQDRVESVPDGFDLIATSDYCPVQAMAHRELPIWTTQFHPEVSYGINEHFADPVAEWDDEKAFEADPNRTLIDNFVGMCLSKVP